MLLSTLLICSLPLKVFSLLGGVPLSPEEIERNKYGAGIYPIDGPAGFEICVFLKTADFRGCIYSTNAQAPSSSTVVIIVMANACKYIGRQSSICVGGSGYMSIVSNASDSLSPKYLSATSVKMVPPKGTKCQILGFSHINGPVIPNKIDVEIMDYQVCLKNFAAISLPATPKRLFCAKFSQGGQDQVRFEPMDALSPIYCPAWEGSQPPSKKNIFWSFGKEDDDAEEEERGENEALIFVGFLWGFKPNTIAPLLFESWPCN